MRKFWIPLHNWKRCGNFETKMMAIIPFFFYIYKRQNIAPYHNNPEKNNIEVCWGCYITPFLSFSFQFGKDEKDDKSL